MHSYYLNEWKLWTVQRTQKLQKSLEKTDNGNLKKVKLAYKNMRDRCYNPKAANYKHYGARGIAVCDEWRENPDTFYQWALDNGGCEPKKSIDRIDNNKNYSKENCRWVGIREQLCNRRVNRYVEVDGKNLALSVAADIVGIKANTLQRRLSTYKMPLEKALSSSNLREKPIIHGTRNGYETHKCRCELCKASNASRAKKYRHDIAGYARCAEKRCNEKRDA